jgi:hypothetical protein
LGAKISFFGCFTYKHQFGNYAKKRKKQSKKASDLLSTNRGAFPDMREPSTLHSEHVRMPAGMDFEKV